MTETRPPIVCIACSIFRSELEVLRAAGEIGFPVRYLSSMLHLHPSELRSRLEAASQEVQGRGSKLLLIYGECHDHMDESEREADCWRVRGRNCVEVFLGPDRYRKLSREGAFFLLPEWTLRWREVFEGELGLAGETSRDFMREMHTKLVYLDTGQMPVPTRHLQEASEALGLPWEVMPIGPEHLLASVRESLEKMVENES